MVAAKINKTIKMSCTNRRWITVIPVVGIMTVENPFCPNLPCHSILDFSRNSGNQNVLNKNTKVHTFSEKRFLSNIVSYRFRMVYICGFSKFFLLVPRKFQALVPELSE